MLATPFKRAARVSSEIYNIIATVCRNELSDPRLRGVQLTDVDMTDDLQIVKIYYYIEGSDEEKKNCLKGFQSAKGYMRRAISERLDLRLTPDIQFYFDKSIEKAEELDKIFDELNKNK